VSEPGAPPLPRRVWCVVAIARGTRIEQAFHLGALCYLSRLTRRRLRYARGISMPESKSPALPAAEILHAVPATGPREQ